MRTGLLALLTVAACSGSSRINLEDLALVEEFPLSGNGHAYRIVIDGDVAYVSDESGFQTFRLTDSSASHLAAFVFEPQSSQPNQPLAIRGSVLAVAHGARIGLVDVSDPAAPRMLSTIDAGSSGTAHALAFDGDYLYWGGDNLKRALVVDPTSPGTPQVIAAQPFDTILIRDGYIYASGPGSFVVFQEPAIENGAAVPVATESLAMATTMIFNGNAIYGSAGYNGSFFVVDASHPEVPAVINDNPVGFETGGGFALHGDQLLLASYVDITRDYDVSDPLHPTEVAALVVPEGYDGYNNYDAARRGNLLLYGNFRGLLVLHSR